MSFKPWSLIPAKLAHDLAPIGVNTLSLLMPDEPPHWKPLEWRGLKFPNRLGLAGGVDKTGKCIKAWPKLGAGFMELGTVTPLPQGPNPGTIIMRNMQGKALWNKMGFPNEGVQALKKNIKNAGSLNIPLFVNIGKNRNTSNEEAEKDYIQCLQEIYDDCDGIVVNISSPNTKGLRELQTRDYLTSFISRILESRPGVSQSKLKPVLIKLSPDSSDEEFSEMLDITLESGVDGWVLTNTTTHRVNGLSFPSEGGMSGAPLKELSFEKLKFAANYIGEKKGDRLMISVGGIMDENDIRMRLANGADLVEIYSALVIEGPQFFRNMGKKLKNWH